MTAGVDLRLIPFDALPGWQGADFAAMWPAWRAHARAAAKQAPPLRAAQAREVGLSALLGRVAAMPEVVDGAEVRSLIEQHCAAFQIGSPGFLTGYYEPVVEGSLIPAPGFAAPLLPRPADLVTLQGPSGPANSPVGSHPASSLRGDDGSRRGRATDEGSTPISRVLLDPSTTLSGHRLPQVGKGCAPAACGWEGSRPAGLPEGFAAARRREDGTLEPYPDRTALEAWALGPEARPVVWLRDWTEVFLIHVQGSARVRLPDGSERRLRYAGRNGHPYTSIGRLLVEAGEIPPAEMSLGRLKAWIRAHGQAVGEPGRALMQRNGSYIFFDLVEADAAAGPIGGAGLPLAPGVSIAVDRSLWSYGLPFWIATDEPVPGFGADPLARLFIAEDTGSAIVGPARVDLFLGSGDAAGDAAGRVRHAAQVAVLLPKAP